MPAPGCVSFFPRKHQHPDTSSPFRPFPETPKSSLCPLQAPAPGEQDMPKRSYLKMFVQHGQHTDQEQNYFQIKHQGSKSFWGFKTRLKGQAGGRVGWGSLQGRGDSVLESGCRALCVGGRELDGHAAPSLLLLELGGY